MSKKYTNNIRFEQGTLTTEQFCELYASAGWDMPTKE